MNRLLRPFKFIFCICEDVNGSVTVDEHDSDLGARSVIHASALTKGPSDYKIATWLRGSSCGDGGGLWGSGMDAAVRWDHLSSVGPIQLCVGHRDLGVCPNNQQRK